MKYFHLPCVLVIAIAISGQCQQKASKYLGQSVPGTSPEVFAPGVVSTKGQTEFGSVFTKEGDVFYYAAEPNGKAEIRSIRFKNNAWGNPEVVLIHDRYSYNDPFLSPDEKRLYFISNRALDGKGDKKDYDIWYIEEKGGRWSEPINAGDKINSLKNEYYISFTNTGTMYFSSNRNTLEDTNNYDVYASQSIKGEFQTPVKLSNAINTGFYEADVFVAPDESYLIFSAERPGDYGRGDLYISFRHANGTWTDAKNVGNKINSEHAEYCPFVTADGKYFLYTMDSDIYWVDASFIDKLK